MGSQPSSLSMPPTTNGCASSSRRERRASRIICLRCRATTETLSGRTSRLERRRGDQPRMYLLDTDVLSELRKRKRDANVMAWIEPVAPADLFLSTVAVFEIE